ncbi:UDP-glucose--hexose-1-phosphate uridylyltransferase [Alteromonas sp. ASW11-36]|uniref:Galactose-1-phosphate uridylyltransferase n=1 Tax=Alteromonas arenosi TaxID=3055817 RepID=A0ABT7SSQ7_9ALTE|nr:UDP-glucose--hexose-1-phosphate uridylyltransferase [Alteromonas sp. ASW11-36]MDM7859222.1 UDP-glucose--hexose-1-phosphate uridylyltransferase [Alteromonas sp. ASW11-36]
MSSHSAFRRRNPLTGEWVLVSPHRNNRPWSGAVEELPVGKLPSHDPNCPLCPGNTRANGESNPEYPTTFVFDNDFAALTRNQSAETPNTDLFTQESAVGLARVICFAPDHNRSLPQLEPAEMFAVVDTWRDQYQQLSEQFNCVHIFENKGEIMGCSQPHPHGQVWAHQHYSTEIERENRHQSEYFEQHNEAMLLEYAEREIEARERLVALNNDWVVVVPYWAKWPFETLLICRHAVADFNDLKDEQAQSLAEIVSLLTTKYDNVFNCSFPYSMGWHNAPSDLVEKRHWVLHAHFYPPLLRSASVKKHMVGYEMLAESQRDLTPELAADILRQCSEVHYLERKE